MRRYIVIAAVVFIPWTGSGRVDDATLHAAESAIKAKPTIRHAAHAPAPPKPSSASPCNGLLLLPGAPMASGRSVPETVLSGDWNGDGKLDLATSNDLDPQIHIRLSNGNGSFQPEHDYPLTKGAIRAISGDFNGDGKPDIATANRDDATVGLLLGRGDGTFAPVVSYRVGNKPQAIGLGDFNRDGKLDLVTVSNTKKGNDVSVLWGNGDGTFRPAISFSLSPLAHALTIGDFNGDGKLDLVTANDGVQLSLGGWHQARAVSQGGNYSVNLLLGNGDGTFQPARPYQVETDPRDVISGDVNRDGKLDLITANQATGVSILLGNGDGTFQPGRTFSSGTIARLTAGDWNGDGNLDVAFFEFSNFMQVLLGNGDGTLQPPVRYAIGKDPGGIASGDWNGDGKLDLAVANAGGKNLSIFLGNGDGTFPKATSSPLPHGAGTAIAADVNGDGRPDLITVDRNDKPNVAVLLRGSDGLLHEAGTYLVGNYLSEVAAGDWNGDGKMDLVVSSFLSNGAYLMPGNGDGTFRPAISVLNDKNYWAVLGADVNADGKLDLLLAAQRGDNVSVLLGKGNGTFQPAVQYGAGHFARQIIAGDWNHDGKLDLATVNDETVSVLLGNGNGTFKSSVAYAAGDHLVVLTSGDWNGDGKLDLAAITGVGTVLGTVHMLQGKGDGTFAPAQHYAPYHSGADHVVSVDLNSDGKLDLVLSSRDNNLVTWLRGNGDGTFQEPLDYATAELPTGVFPGDWNGDGRPDLEITHALPQAVSLLLSSCR